MNVFISYRRADSLQVVGRIYDHLVERLGAGSVFMDYDSIAIGANFRETLLQVLRSTDVVLVIIGPNWLVESAVTAGTTSETVTQFVRLELTAALDLGLKIVPVLLGKCEMPNASLLPDALKGITQLQASQLDLGRDFVPHMNRLVSDLGIIALSNEEKSHSGELREPEARPISRISGAFPKIALGMTLGFVSALISIAIPKLHSSLLWLGSAPFGLMTFILGEYLRSGRRQLRTFQPLRLIMLIASSMFGFQLAEILGNVVVGHGPLFPAVVGGLCATGVVLMTTLTWRLRAAEMLPDGILAIAAAAAIAGATPFFSENGINVLLPWSAVVMGFIANYAIKSKHFMTEFQEASAT